MGLKLHFSDLENIIYESGKQHYNIDEAGVQQLDFIYDYKDVNGWYKEIILDNFKIGYGQSKLSQKATIHFDFDEETVEMHFSLKGYSTTTIKAAPLDFTANENTHNIYYCNDIRGKVDWYSNEMFIFEINLEPAFFKKYLSDDGLSSTFKKIIQNKELGVFSKHDHPITPAMLSVIHEIISCSWKDQYRQLFLEAKVLELLLLQLEQFRLCDLCLESNNSSKIIIDKMHHAKEIILSKLNNPLCLSDLAKNIGTNECTLKKEFKNVYGTTVFGYIKDLKMEESKNMLLHQEFTIREISDKIGYKNPQHFSTAFKRKFGVPPSEFLKKY